MTTPIREQITLAVIAALETIPDQDGLSVTVTRSEVNIFEVDAPLLNVLESGHIVDEEFDSSDDRIDQDIVIEGLVSGARSEVGARANALYVAAAKAIKDTGNLGVTYVQQIRERSLEMEPPDQDGGTVMIAFKLVFSVEYYPPQNVRES